MASYLKSYFNNCTALCLINETANGFTTPVTETYHWRFAEWCVINSKHLRNYDRIWLEQLLSSPFFSLNSLLINYCYHCLLSERGRKIFVTKYCLLKPFFFSLSKLSKFPCGQYLNMPKQIQIEITSDKKVSMESLMFLVTGGWSKKYWEKKQ